MKPAMPTAAMAGCTLLRPQGKREARHPNVRTPSTDRPIAKQRGETLLLSHVVDHQDLVEARLEKGHELLVGRMG